MSATDKGLLGFDYGVYKRDMSMLQKLPEIANFENTNTDWAKKQAVVNSYLEPAFVHLFQKLGINNVREEQQ